MKFVKNNGGAAKSYLGQEIQPGSYYQIQPLEELAFANDSTVLADIGSGDLVVAKSGDGLSDISDVGEAINFLKNIESPWPKTDVQQIPKVSVYKPEGSSSTKVSYDWTDKCTWYQKSTRVIDGAMSLESGLTYQSGNPFWIDLSSGRLYEEDSFASAHSISVRDDSGVIDPSGYSVDYEAGKVTLNQSPTGSVLATYSYATTSEWVLAPTAGKVLHIEHAELQFSKNVQMSPVAFQIWVYNPADLPNKIMYQQIIYKNEKDVVGAANLGQGFIPAFGQLTQDILVFPFNYATVKSLQSSVGAELRVRVLNDVPFSGEFATATFYVLSTSEVV